MVVPSCGWLNITAGDLDLFRIFFIIIIIIFSALLTDDIHSVFSSRPLSELPNHLLRR